MVTLENDFLRVNIRSQGAELTSIYSKKDQTEYLWQGDEAVWGWYAPHLFPIIGACLENQVNVDGQKYPLGKHGFARTSTFRRIESTPVHAKFALHYSDETLKSYPYKFEFQVLYDLFDTKIRVSYKVINLDSGTIYFSVGAHPAFNVPLVPGGAYEDYYLEFENEEVLRTHVLNQESHFSGETRPVELENGRLNLNRHLFDADALVFKNLASRKVILGSDKHAKRISVSFPHFNFLGIWAKPGADFLCIEPWLGCADTVGKAVELKDKEGVQYAEHGHVFETDFCIQIHPGV